MGYPEKIWVLIAQRGRWCFAGLLVLIGVGTPLWAVSPGDGPWSSTGPGLLPGQTTAGLRVAITEHETDAARIDEAYLSRLEHGLENRIAERREVSRRMERVAPPQVAQETNPARIHAQRSSNSRLFAGSGPIAAATFKRKTGATRVNASLTATRYAAIKTIVKRRGIILFAGTRDYHSIRNGYIPDGSHCRRMHNLHPMTHSVIIQRPPSLLSEAYSGAFANLQKPGTFRQGPKQKNALTNARISFGASQDWRAVSPLSHGWRSWAHPNDMES